MAKRLQLRGGTTAQNNAFTGAARELTVNTDNWSLRVHDGVTPGGKILSDWSNVTGNLLPSANVTYDLGSASKQWRSLYVSGNTIYIGGQALSVQNNTLVINGNTLADTVLGDVNIQGNIIQSDQMIIRSLDGNLTLGATGNVLIRSSGNVNQWLFSASGNIKLPAGGDILDHTGNSVLGGGGGGAEVTLATPYLIVGGAKYGPVYPISDPGTVAWSWVNQASATLTVTNGAQTLSAPTSWPGAGINMRMTSAPVSTPYTVTALISMTTFASGNYLRTGMALRESDTQKVITWGGINSGDMGVDYWNNPYSYVTTPWGPQFWNNTQVFLRAQNTGTDLIFSLSGDGLVYSQTYTIPVNSFFTTGPDQMGFYIYHNSFPPCAPISMTLLSWLVN